MVFRMFLHDVVIISNKVNNYLHRTYHNNVKRTLLLLHMLLFWVQASHYWLGKVIQKTSIEKIYEKHSKNDLQCFHTLKVSLRIPLEIWATSTKPRSLKNVLQSLREQFSVVQALILDLKTDNVGLFLFCLVQISMT